MHKVPVFKDIVLAGGGHAHALFIRMWAMNPLPGVRLTLVSPDPLTPYSGMLPGLIAGHYQYHDIHIDLVKLCQKTAVRFIQSEVTALDPDARRLSLKGRSDLHYDVLSVDIGSRPNFSIQGAEQFATPVKPISGFFQRWQSFKQLLHEEGEQRQVVVVGGGAGSVEIILAMAWAVRSGQINNQKTTNTHFTLVYPHQNVLPGYPEKVVRTVTRELKAAGIQLQADFSVSSVKKGIVENRAGLQVNFDSLFWCTHADAADWPSAGGLACSEKGFIQVNEYLQSTSHANVFAAGDIAEMIKTPRPKAGVYAVRQAR